MDMIKLDQIQVDENQPRKYFNAEKMHSLRESIRREGIISPLIVEKIGNKYLVIDGERRYRAAVELKLDKVPVVIEETKKAVDRLVRQFTVQEQHEAWTPVEKSIALIKLSDELGTSLPETCKLLSLTAGDIRRTVAFASLVDKDAWVRHEIPLTFVEHYSSFRNTAKRVTERELNQEWTRSDDKKLERRAIHGIKEGTIQKRNDLTRLADAFIKEPKSLKKFLENEKISAMGLFLETGAQGSLALRNVMYNAAYITTHGKKFLEQKDVKISDGQVAQLKRAKEVINKLISVVE